MAEFKPLLYSIGILVILGIVIPGVFSYFVDIDTLPTSSLTDSLTGFIEVDLTLDVLLFEINLNPFAWLGSTFRSYISDSVSYLAIYPTWLLVSLMLLVLISITYTIITLVRGN